MAENNKEVGAKRGGLIYKIVGGAAVVLVLVLIFIGGKKDSESPNDANADTNSENDTALHVVQPVVAGDYEYTFSGVKWTFDTESQEVAGTNQTWLKMEFADFTRNGNAISFGRPYKLGVHPGICEEVDFMDTADLEGIPFAYASCEGAGVTHDFVVLQRLETVVVMMNETKGGTASGWKDWYSINVTEIVR